MRTATAALRRIPVLREGDPLDQPEFHRRYRAMPEEFRAELLERRVYVRTRVLALHAGMHALISGWMMRYGAFTPGVQSLTSPTTILGPWCEPEPDAVMHIEPDCGGNVTVTRDEFTKGIPEFIAEVAYPDEDRDRVLKFREYARAGVLEYLIVLAKTGTVRWNRLVEGTYVEMQPLRNILRSRAFPGLWLNVRALFADDPARMLRTLNDGLKHNSHRQFVAELKRRRRRHANDTTEEAK